MPIDNISISILLDFQSSWCLSSEDIFGLLVSYYWGSSCRTCWSFNNLCSQSCLLHFCYYFCTEFCVRVPHFNYTANKASSLPRVSPVANQCCGKILQGNPSSSAVLQRKELNGLERTWGEQNGAAAPPCRRQRAEFLEWRSRLPVPSSLPALTFSGVFSVQLLGLQVFQRPPGLESCCQPR